MGCDGAAAVPHLRHFYAVTTPAPSLILEVRMAKRDYDFLFKLVLIGDTGVGKSCLLLRFAVSRHVVVGSQSSWRCPTRS
jgi:hypothetical protein